MDAMIEQAYSQFQAGKKSLQFSTGENIDFGIVGGNTFGRYKKISSEETYNMMVSDGALVNFPGYSLVKELFGENGREIYTSTRYNKMIAVVSDNVFAISTDLSFTLVGSLNTFSGDVFIAENLGSQIAICDGFSIYIFNYQTNSFQEISVDFLPGCIAFQDTYFIATDKRTNQWRLSGNNDGTSWPADSGHVGVIQTKASNAVAPAVLDRQLFIFGQTFAEPWYDVGYTLFPYQRTNFYSIDYGTLSPATIAVGFGLMVWLGSNEKTGISIMVSQGGAPQKLSNDGLDFIFANLKSPKDSYAFLFREAGHIFYVLTFTTDNLTYVYDFNTKMFFTLTDKDMNHHIARRITFFNGKYYFVSFKDGNLYEISSRIYKLSDHQIPRFRILKHLRLPSGDRFAVRNINITMEQGILENENKNDLSVLPISRPRIDLAASKDGGESYRHVASKTLNTFGRRENVCNLWNLGSYVDLTLKFAFWGDQRFCINRAYGNIYQ
jgi:hypothetical protein